MSISLDTEQPLTALVELDPEGTVLFLKWNEEEKLPHSPNELVGRNFFSEVAPFENISELRDRFETFHCGSSSTNSFSFNCKYEDRSERVRVLLARLRADPVPGRSGAVLMYIKKAA
jgi:hypothetical protein